MCFVAVYNDCPVTINGTTFTVDHNSMDILVLFGICYQCRCNNGSFESCEIVDCPFNTDSGTQMCTVDGTVYQHMQTFVDDCNECRCLNGRVQCTTRDCDNSNDSCREMQLDPVCARNFRTYPNHCAALRAGFGREDIFPGRCSRDVRM